MTKRDLPKNTIIKLYMKDKKSSKEIARIYKCSSRTILLRLHIWKVKMRPPGTARIFIDKKELKQLYLVKKLSTWQIPKILGYDRGTIHRKLKEFGIQTRDIADSHMKYSRKNFSENNIEKAYLVGFTMGDLRVRKVGRKSKTIKIGCGSTKSEQIKLFSSLFEKYGRVWISKIRHGKVNVEAFLDTSFSFLLSPENELPTIYKSYSTFLSFLAGFIDAEGSFFITKGKGALSIGNYNKKLLTAISKNLEKKGIKCHLYVDKHRYRSKEGYVRKGDYCMLRLNRMEDLLKLIDLIRPYLKHENRIKQLYKVQNNIITRMDKM
ncbi:MAG TPA: LAGLIDADG family homing endonuclease [Candidatus Acidoferrum sp.]|nr:LAGLIDADG family homing endonuclease [Candidatus Acidoferrum sp.]